MSALTPREQLEIDLDHLIIQAHERREFARDIERKLRKAEEATTAVDVEVQRTRMALFALDGEHSKNFADANVANSKRLSELLRSDQHEQE